MVVQQMRRRRMMHEAQMRVARRQRRKTFLIQADDGNFLRRQHRKQQRRHIRAGGDMRRPQPERARGVPQELRIQQAQPGGIVKLLQLRQPFQPRQMVGVGCDDIGKPRRRAAVQQMADHLARFGVIERQA